MFGRSIAWPTLVASLWGPVAFVAPAWAEVPFLWAEVQSVVNQVEMQATDGSRRWAVPTSCLCPGYTLSTQGVSQAELRLNDGSLMRIGEQSEVQVQQGTRILRLLQGTTLLFTQPSQGRTAVETPNALIAVDHTAVVVRYVPSRNLTLVMALADAETGPIAVTLQTNGQEGVLYAGQMALASAEGLEIIEFDLLEFYRTSRLVMGLALDGEVSEGGRLADSPSSDPVALLRPQLLRAVVQQTPFANDTILNPSLINDLSDVPGLLEANQEVLQPNPLNQSVSPSQSPSSLPAGVVVPLPDAPTSPEDPPPSVPEPSTTVPSSGAPLPADPLPSAPLLADPPTADPLPTAPAPAPPPTSPPVEPTSSPGLAPVPETQPAAAP